MQVPKYFLLPESPSKKLDSTSLEAGHSSTTWHRPYYRKLPLLQTPRPRRCLQTLAPKSFHQSAPI